MAWLQSLQMGEILVYGCAFGLPVVAIGSGMVVAIVKALIKHRERMAMIEHGLYPDESLADAETKKCWAKCPEDLDETQPYVPRHGRPEAKG